MANKSVAISLLLLTALTSEAQQLPEVLQDVEPSQARSLEQYNSAFLQEYTYFASRHRIVKVDVAALRQGRDVTVTPFDDVEPIGLVFERFTQWDTFWHGSYRDAPRGIFAITIGMFAYDVDESGAAVHAAQDRGKFFSVSAVFDVPGHNKYVLQPLKYTPRYSVIYEITRDTLIPYRIDIMPGDPPPSAEEQAAFKAYREFVDALPDETDKRVVGDIP
jgi:hypothetical protein